MEQIGTPYDVYNKPATEYVATFLGAANLLLGVVRGRNFESENINLELEDEMNFKDFQSVKLVFRPEDVFLRKPENLSHFAVCIFSFSESSRFCASTASAECENFPTISRQLAPS